MANGMYVKAKEAFAGGDLDWDGSTNKVSLMDTGAYTVNLSTHDFFDDLSGVVASSDALASLTKTNGVCDAANKTIEDVSGDTVEAVIPWRDTTNPATSNLYCYIDTGTGFPLNPNGGDVDVVFNASGIFAL